jgi:Flp pilus assembly protein TadG
MTMRRPRSAQRAQALVELAFVLPVFLMLTMAVVDFGRGIWTYNAVAFLARDGARFATIPSRSSLDVQNYIADRCERVLSNPCAATITIADRGTCGDTADPVVVHVEQPFGAIMSSFWGGGPLDLEATSRMYVELGPAGGCAA